MTGQMCIFFFCCCCSFQWSFVVANTDYSLSWLASGTCDLSFNSSFLMIPWTPYWSPFPCPLPFIKHLWNFILTVQTKPTQWPSLFFSSTLHFPPLHLMYNITNVLMYTMYKQVICGYTLVIIHWSFLVITTYILHRNIKNINFENKLKIYFQPFLSPGIGTLLGLLEIINETFMDQDCVSCSPAEGL